MFRRYRRYRRYRPYLLDVQEVTLCVMVDPFSPTPLYVQVADLIAGRIARKELEPLKPIPSEDRLAEELGVARGTVRRAVQELRDRGLVFTLPQRGTYVADK